MGGQNQGPAVGIHESVALAAVDFLAGVVTAWAARLGGLDALAVHHGSRRTGFAAGSLAVEHHENDGSGFATSRHHESG